MLAPFYHKNRIEAGCDEAGRGCLAGSVFAAAVILPSNFSHPLLNDSKKLSEKKRQLLRTIIEKEAVSWAVASVQPTKIDDINILQASILAMHLALKKLSTIPEFILIDGNYFKPFSNIPHQCVVKGDGKYASIAAASVLAKTHRDEHMCELNEKYPQYGWATNKGYPTKAHREAIQTYGISPQHRLSFKLLAHKNELF